MWAAQLQRLIHVWVSFVSAADIETSPFARTPTNQRRRGRKVTRLCVYKRLQRPSRGRRPRRDALHVGGLRRALLGVFNEFINPTCVLARTE